MEQRKFIANAWVWTTDIPGRSYTVYVFPGCRRSRNKKNAPLTDPGQNKPL